MLMELKRFFINHKRGYLLIVSVTVLNNKELYIMQNQMGLVREWGCHPQQRGMKFLLFYTNAKKYIWFLNIT